MRRLHKIYIMDVNQYPPDYTDMSFDHRGMVTEIKVRNKQVLKIDYDFNGNVEYYKDNKGNWYNKYICNYQNPFTTYDFGLLETEIYRAYNSWISLKLHLDTLISNPMIDEDNLFSFVVVDGCRPIFRHTDINIRAMDIKTDRINNTMEIKLEVNYLYDKIDYNKET